MNKLYEYKLRFIQMNEGEECELFWRCQAENYEHAEEQLRNAEPEGIVSIEQTPPMWRFHHRP